MNTDIIIIFIILAGSIVLFSMEKFPIDLIAIILIAVLLITGIITPEEGISGFSNTATVTVAAMFILSASLFNSGAFNFVGGLLTAAFSKNLLLGLFLLIAVTALLSAFINVTATVAMLLPVLINTANKTDISPSKLLIPLSFGALLGGVGTLIGTSTNILVSSMIQQRGEAPFHMFETTPLALIILAAGILFLVFIGSRILPDRKNYSELTEEFEMNDYITEVVLLPESESVGKMIKKSPLIKDLDLDIIEIQRGGNNQFVPNAETVLEVDDILRIRCDINKLKEIQEKEGIELKSQVKLINNDEFKLRKAKLVEAVVTHNSRLRGRTIKDINFRETYGATCLAIRHRGQLMHTKLGHISLLPGDVLLVEVKEDWLPRFRQNSDFVIASEVNLLKVKKAKIIISISIMTAVVATASFGIFPIVKAAVIGSVLAVLTGCISLEEAYKSINWKVIFLFAGVLTLSLALEKTGGAEIISSFIISSAGSIGNKGLVSVFFLITLLFTNFMSNNAIAALLVPIALITSESLGISARPFIMAVTFAASLSFMTPISYQTNTMVSGPGNYKFSDYLKVGGPLNLIIWLLASVLIPVFFPF